MSALDVPEESPFKNPDQIPYLKPPPPSVQNLARVEDEDKHEGFGRGD